MNKICLNFGRRALNQEDIEGKTVLEVGSMNMNGSYRNMIMNFKPLSYLGIDIKKGLGVDKICRAGNMIKEYGKESFDVVISTETLEHIRNWKKAISNIKNVCKRRGMILITTCSRNFPRHDFPGDHWRYEQEDLGQIFSDCEILRLEKADRACAVFIKVRKPRKFREKDLSELKLYNIISDKRI